jgi:hypothetical protein
VGAQASSLEQTLYDLIAISLKAAPMSQNDALRLPGLNLFNCRPRLASPQQKGQAHTKEDLSTGVIHSRYSRRQAPRLTDLVQLKVYYGVGEYKSLGRFMKKNDLSKNAAGNCRLIDVIAPLRRWSRTEVDLELHINSPCACTLACARGGPGNGFGKSS